MKTMFKPFLLFFFVFNTFYLLAQPPSSDYNLVFVDYFGDDEVDPDAWWIGPSGSAVCESQGEGGCACDMWYSQDNVVEEFGGLILTAREETTTCNGVTKEYTSGKVQTAADFKYGYYEIRALIPEDNGLWPAFWFWSGNINTEYNEIDVFEFCGCDCSQYKAGYFYEDDNNQIANDNIEHLSEDIGLRDDACDNYNIYGVEWTPTHIRFYLDGELKVSFLNNGLHDPMPIILNLAVGGCFGGCGSTYCGDLSWDMDGSCHVTCETTFPKSFIIDWVKGWQKNNAAVYITGSDDLCLGETAILRTPNYPHATYAWSTSSPNLQITPSNYLNFDGGVWKYATINPQAPGSYTVTLTVTFPDGYVETKTHQVQVSNTPPPTPIDIVFQANEVDCCYEMYTPVVESATSYIWTVGTYTTTTTSHYYTDECFIGGNLSVSVQAVNACGTSPVYSESNHLPPLRDCSPFHEPGKMVIIPNPVATTVRFQIMDKDNQEIEDIEGQIMIKDNLDNIVYSSQQKSKVKSLDISHLKNGLYHLSFLTEGGVISASFVKNIGY